MNSKRTFVRTILLAVAAVATMASVSIHSPQAFADLNCASTVSGSTQQGAICLPSDPTGVSSSIPDHSIEGVILEVIQFALGFAMLIAIAFVIIGGYRYIFDGGNGDQAEKGKKTITNALIGIVVIILSYTIVTVVSHTASNLNNGGSSTTSSSTATPAEPSTSPVLCSDGTYATPPAVCGG